MEKMLITGASRGIGLTIAEKFANKDRELILLARSEPELAKIVEDFNKRGYPACYYVCDLSIPDSVDETAKRILREKGRVDQLILNAGVSTNSNFLDHDLSSIQKELQVNYLSVLQFVKIFAPEMIQANSGSIVSIGSMVALLPFPGNSSYAASKSALYSFFQSFRLEVSKYNIFVGSVLPGLTKTEMTKDFHSTLLPFDDPEDVASAVDYALKTKTRVVIPGLMNNMATEIYKLFPDPVNFVIEKLSDFLVPMAKPNRI